VHTEHAGEAAERVGLAAAEGVRGDIRITEGDDGDTATRERPQQRERRLRCLLQVVDEHETQGIDARVPVGGDRRDGELHKFGRVELVGAGCAYNRDVLVDEVGRGGPLWMPQPLAERTELRGVDAVLGRAHHELAQLGAEPAESPHVWPEHLRPARTAALGEVPVEQAGDVAVLVAAGHESRQWCAGDARRRRDDIEREGVDRAGERTVGRPRDSQRDRIAQAGRARAARREHHEFVRRPSPIEDAVGDELDEGRGLARARGAEHRGGCRFGEVEHDAL